MDERKGMDAPTTRRLPSLAQIGERRRSAAPSSRKKKLPPLVPQPRPALLPLSFAQERLWFLDQLGTTGAAYNTLLALRLRGTLDSEALGRSVTEICRRHEILRTVFVPTEGRPVQRILPCTPAIIGVTDLTHFSDAERLVQMQAHVDAERQRPFDLATGPLFDVSLVRLATEDQVLVMRMHHIVMDGWSVGVLVRELSALYSACRNDPPVRLPEPTLQYADYAIWQRASLQGDSLTQQLAYWKQTLRDVPTLQLPTDRPRPSVASYRGAAWSFVLPSSLARQLNRLSQDHGATLFMTLLAAFSVLLNRYSGQDDIVVGTSVAGRAGSATENLIGCFVNSLALRTRIEPQLSFRDVLARVRTATLAAYAHQDLPFDQLVMELQPERSLTRQPIHQVMLVLQNFPHEPATFEGLTCDLVRTEQRTAQFDLTLHMVETPEGLAGAFEYATDLFDADTIARMGGHLRTLLAAIVATPGRRVGRLPLLSETERQQQLREWNTTAADYPRDLCFHDLFFRQCERTPEAVAVRSEGQSLSYAALGEKADRLAVYLRSLGAGRDARVALCLSRDTNLLVALLGVLKAGAAYLPLDPSAPPERLRYMLEDARVPIILTDTRSAAALPEHSALRILMDADQEEIARPTLPLSAACTDPEDLAYVIYTSGSTGRPKGVMICHRALINYLWSAAHHYRISAATSAFVATPLAFDATITTMLVPLVCGGSVTLPAASDQDVISGFRPETRAAHSLFKLTPSQLSALQGTPAATCTAGADVPPAVVVVGGEELTASHVEVAQSVFAPARIINEYGPTETVVGCAIYEAGQRPDLEKRSLPIGRPLANTQLYVLDAAMELLPPGVAGELFIGGDGLARGYLNRPGLTAQRFVASPFVPGARLYRTGDLARFGADGTLEFLGRIDHQVKLRGYRIELGEIEATLLSHPAVRQASVLLRESAGAKRLVAYAASSASGVQLHEYLTQRLPEYMVPAVIEVLPALPLTPNGKVDRRALPDPSATATVAAFVAPRTPLEATLAKIWSEVLNVARIGIHDDFFRLGGDSIASIRAAARARQAGLHITVRQLFQHPTIAQLAEAGVERSVVTAPAGDAAGEVPLTPSQIRWLEEQPEWPNRYIVPLAFEWRAEIGPDVLERALEYLVRHHDALRTRFRRTASGWEQVLSAELPIEVLRHDLTGIDGSAQERAIADITRATYGAIDIEAGRCVSAQWIGRAPAPPLVIIAIHHLVFDWVSLMIFLEDLHSACRQLAAEQPVQLPPRTASFREWSRSLRAYARDADWAAKSPRWHFLQDTAGRLPRDFPEGRNTYSSVSLVQRRFSAAQRAALGALAASLHVSLRDVLVAAIARAVAKWTGQSRVIAGIAVNGRECPFDAPDISRTIGWFAGTCPVAIDCDPTPKAREFLQDVSARLSTCSRDAIEYGTLRYLVRDERLRITAEPEIYVNYLGALHAPAENSPFVMRPWPVVPETPQELRPMVLSIELILDAGEIAMHLQYSHALHRTETIEALAQDIFDWLQALGESS